MEKNFFTNSKAVLEQLAKIKSAKTRRYNKMGEWLSTRKEAPFVYSEKDLRYIMR